MFFYRRCTFVYGIWRPHLSVVSNMDSCIDAMVWIHCAGNTWTGHYIFVTHKHGWSIGISIEANFHRNHIWCIWNALMLHSKSIVQVTQWTGPFIIFTCSPTYITFKSWLKLISTEITFVCGINGTVRIQCDYQSNVKLSLSHHICRVHEGCM